MSVEARQTAQVAWTPFEQLREGREIIQQESRALGQIAKRLSGDFCRAANCLFACRGSVIVSGMGKAGLIGQKIAATLASTGTAAHFLHPAEAVHGDLGRVRRGDVVLMLSQSGETDEIVRILPSLRAAGALLLAITARADSTLGRAALATLELGKLDEAGALGLAPTTSAVAMLALGDALALVVSQMRGFRREDFARFHPAGSLGLKLSKVEEHMRPIEQCRIAEESLSVREVLVGNRVAGRRTGATMLVDAEGRLSGVFTDSDLARLFERRREGELDTAICTVMTHQPLRVTAGTLMTEAVTILAERKISELPVVDDDQRPVGLIDITDVVSLLPQEIAQQCEGPAAVPFNNDE